MTESRRGGTLWQPLAPRSEGLGGIGAPPARSLLDVFAATVARCPDSVALDAPDGTYTYRGLSDAVALFADRLRKLGIGPGDRIGVYVRSGTAQLYVAILGVLHAGAAYVPVDADDPPARATTIWASSGACAVVEDGLRINQLSAATGADRELIVDDDAWVIFTSGSSGEPKGVAVSHRSAAAFVDAEASLWTVDPTDRVLAGLSVGFDASCEEIWLAWRNGAALVPAPRALVRAATELGPWLTDRQVTVISTVPTLAAMWSDADIDGVRLLILGGEPCPESLAWRLASDREVWNTYGPTEATVVTTATPLRRGEPVTIGRPLPGWQVAVVDERGEPVPFGEPGELAIAGVGLGRYLDPALDAERYPALPAFACSRAYRTGDTVRETVNGMQFIGRRDDQVKLGGRRLELGELDAQLSALPGITAAASALKRTAAGNPVLVGYVVGDVIPTEVRNKLAERLPEGIVPLVVVLDSLPTSASGKVNRKALPWPPPRPRPTQTDGATRAATLTGTATWLAERWAEQLGPLPMSADSDFFELGGSSLAAAKLVSAIRSRYPSVAVADLYAHRRLGELAARLDRLETSRGTVAPAQAATGRRGGVFQLAGVFALLALSSPQWLVAILAVDHLAGRRIGPEVGWGWVIGGWLIFGTAMGRAAVLLLGRRLLLPRLAPGRYPRHGWLMCRLWFLERLARTFRSESLAGTPFAARFARLCGHCVGAHARLGTLPPITSLITIGEGATLEAEVDAHGWWLQGDQLVVGELRIGPGARVGRRALLGPGAEIGAGAEVEPGSVISGSVPPGQRWAGSPARHVGTAGDGWPQTAAPRPAATGLWRAMYVAGLSLQTMLPLLAAAPPLLLLQLFGIGRSDQGIVISLTRDAPVVAAGFLITYAVLVALAVRLVGTLVRPGWHPAEGRVGWATWFSESLMASARKVLFPLFSSLYTRPWLRLAGVRIGKRAEVSTAVGLSHLTSFADRSFAADDVVLATARARNGWLNVAPIEVGSGTFLGNGAIMQGGTTLGRDGLIGALTTAPPRTADGTSWFGSPALELPRVPDAVDPSRTTNPPRRLILARGTMDAIRIVLPTTISVGLAALVFWALDAIGHASSVATMVAATPFVLLGAGVCAVTITVAAKWLIIGRYRPGEHPLWSFYVWRDEIMNSVQDRLAGAWLLNDVLGTPLMSMYLRATGAMVGRDVWCETMALTEFDVVELGDGCVVNRIALIETHLFHDRLLRIGPATLGPGSSLGPASAVLPDTALGAGVCVGGRSVVLRGEELPPGTRWHGAPVVSM